MRIPQKIHIVNFFVIGYSRSIQKVKCRNYFYFRNQFAALIWTSQEINIPDEVALAGFSNLHITDLLCPSLTVVKQPALRMGKLAAQLLIKTIESKGPITNYEDLVLPVELKIGESTRAKAL